MAAKALVFHLDIFTVCGVLKPRSCDTIWKKRIYSTYTYIIVGMLYLMVASQLLVVVVAANDISEFVELTYLVGSGLTVFNKTLQFLLTGKRIVPLLKLLDADICQTTSPEEEAILLRYNQRIRSSTMYFFTLIMFFCFATVVSSIPDNIPNRTLPLYGWYPYNYTDDNVYWITYLHQVMAIMYTGTFTSCFDTMVVGVMLTLCGQMQILQFRNSNMSSLIIKFHPNTRNRRKFERLFVIESIKHHQLIIQFAKAFNEIILSVIFVQYAISCFGTCVSVYRLTHLEVNDPDFLVTIVYCMCTCVQTFYYCWYGNEVIEESLKLGNSLFSSEWHTLDVTSMKDVGIMIHRMQTPIQFSCTSLFVLSNEAGKNILKLTYSLLGLLLNVS